MESQQGAAAGVGELTQVKEDVGPANNNHWWVAKRTIEPHEHGLRQGSSPNTRELWGIGLEIQATAWGPILLRFTNTRFKRK